MITFDSERQEPLLCAPPSTKDVEGDLAETHLVQSGSGPLTKDMVAGRRHILLAEDNADLLYVICAILEHFEFDVVPCGNPTHALNLFRKHPDSDLLLTDLQMPEMSGVELAMSLTAVEPSLPVLMMSASILPSAVRNTISRQGWRFLTKPFAAPDLLQQIIEMAKLPRTLDLRTSELY